MVNWRLLLVGISVVLILGAATGLAADGFDEPDTEDLETDDTVIQIDLRSDGSAEWSMEHRYRLADEEQEQAFASLKQDIEENESAYLDRFTERMESTVDAAVEATGRDMAVQNASVTAETRNLPREYGIVTYRFEWTNFAASDDHQLEAGDALAGLFLDDQTRLLVTWPSDYALDSVNPDPDDTRETTVTWRGPIDFGPNEPRVAVSSAAQDDSGAVSSAPIYGSVPAFVLAGAVVVIVIGIGGGVWWLRSNRQVPWASDDGAVAGSATSTTASESSDVASDSDPELLSNEEQVLQLVAEHDGRIKQQEVVQTLEWTDAKTSQVVRGLREEGKIESFRLGRENVLKLPDEDDRSDI